MKQPCEHVQATYLLLEEEGLPNLEYCVMQAAGEHWQWLTFSEQVEVPSGRAWWEF